MVFVIIRKLNIQNMNLINRIAIKFCQKLRAVLLYCIMIFAASSLYAQNNLTVYPPVPGLSESEFYSLRVRQVGSSNWMTPFAFITRCVESTPENDDSHYYSKWLGSWSNTYINFEMEKSTQVEIEISKKDGSDITKAVAHPQDKVISCNVVGGKAYVVIEDPALFAVDIDGQMDDQDTGRLKPDGWGEGSHYSGPPIHTITIFANPIIEDRPSVSDPDVYAVNPGDNVPEDGSWSTLYFMPGVHDVGVDFRVHANKKYYIPGDAIVYGTFNNNLMSNDGENIHIFGHGTLSGARIPHPEDDGAMKEDYFRYRPIDIRGAKNIDVEGITIADSPYHTVMISNSYDPNNPCWVRWVKIFTWRSNGDGINPFGNVGIEDCFLRTQDDCVYTNGLGMRRIVFWTDANGSAFVLSPVGGIDNPNLIIEDCDIIYSRSVFTPGGRGGCIFNLRGDGGGEENGHRLTFRNIRVEDKRPTRTAFNLRAANDTKLRDTPGAVTNIVWQDITIAEQSIIGDLQTIYGHEGAPLYNLVFDNVVIAGELIDNINDFEHNDFVYDLLFRPIQNNLITNADFSSGDLTGWIFTSMAPSAAAASVINEECFVDITNDDSTDWHINLSQENLNLEFDSTYTLFFDARSESSRSLIAQIKSTSGNVLWKTFNINSFMNTYSVTFKNDSTTANNYQLLFILGSQGDNDVWIDNVALLNSDPIYSLTTETENGSIEINPLRDYYISDTKVTLTATGDLGYSFTSWGGDLTGSENPITVIMDSDKHVIAKFDSAKVYTLTTSASGGTIVLDPEGPQYSDGTVVKVEAIADPEYVFTGWSGDALNFQTWINPNYIIMDSDKSISANFVGPPVQTDLWVENFVFANGTNSDDGSTSWTAERSSGVFAVIDNRLAINDAGPEGIFNTEEIDISSGMVNVYVKVEGEGGLDPESSGTEDYFGIFKKVDGGQEELIYENYGAQSTTTISDSGITGNSLVLIIKGYTTASDEFYYFDYVKITLDEPTSVSEYKIILPKETYLQQNYPNPFNPQTTISYQLANFSQVNVEIYNLLGRNVATLVDKKQPAGYYNVIWQGKNNSGNSVASGIYFFKLKTDNIVQIKKLILLR